MPTFPSLPDRAEIRRRLELIFPEGLTNRNYVVREMAASTVFVMLYLGAVEGADYYIKPDQVTRMTDEQAAKLTDEERTAWRKASTTPGGASGWYAKNTREPIRDETLRSGLVEYGAAMERTDLPTTSPKGRYALTASFAQLFDPTLGGDALAERIAAWNAATLSAGARARAALLRRAAVPTAHGVLVTFPNGETRRLATGPSSEIAKAVVEDFAPRFLKNPGVLWISESGQRETYRDATLLKDLGVTLRTDRVLPDIILVDLGAPGDTPLFVFVEVVASDGPVTEQRRTALLALITEAGYDANRAAFVTAYLDRDNGAFKRTMPALAWSSFAWFLSEPDKIISLRPLKDGSYLADLLEV